MESIIPNFQFAMPTPEVTVLKMSHKFMINYNYLVVDPITREAVIVDPAWQTEKVDEALVEANAHLVGVLVTHSHPDHIDLAAPLSKKYECPIWMSKQEVKFSNYRAEHLVPIDESPLKVGNIVVQPIFTPGHTPGCFCFLIGDNLFTGDVLFAEGCGMCPDTESAYSMFESLQRIRTLIKPATRIFPGHSYGRKPGQLFEDVTKENIYLQFDKKESFAAFRLRSGQKKSFIFNFS
ncbi:MAG: MBL fold metallo-hydrolase [Kangiellaceae bacterium]|nr:MBL fold metallo-hydrolase [Kangiellaceae bacterium]MCW8998388.1 MBL fold metallo-hydrolase [Kangiellaceae bacterium]